ncbi:flagellar brake protein [Oceanobacillus sp. J11TS1]|uniref:flagellar brake protein n=1 Tax=Oceanobacillus sp. J11TS1 TaxID=2807191 RepID=UPI001B13F470|nr:PilZ domain-containing protein [Oceanobacillus sp. J11TS1]GIO23517.1 hypothetical protein J11TS1_20980 [Oceanobacillus sp. J11TS1]
MSGKEFTEFWNGQLFEIITPAEKIYFTQIIRNESELLIQKPVNKQNVPMLIESDMMVTVYFHNDEKGLCKFESEIRYHSNGKISLEKPYMDAIEVVQRRKFFRVKVMEKMDLILPPAKDTEETEGESITVTTHDISGGGVSFIAHSKKVEVGDEVTGVLYLKTKLDTQKIEFKGKVVNVIKQANKMYKNAIQFIDMREGKRSKILKYCISKQIEIRNKIKG